MILGCPQLKGNFSVVSELGNVRALASASPDRSTGRIAHVDGPTFEAHDDHTGQLLLYKEAL